MKPEFDALLDLCKATGVEPPVSVRADQQQASSIIAKCIEALQPLYNATGFPDNVQDIDVYTRQLHYASVDETYGRKWLAEHRPPVPMAGCTAVWKNGWLLRNFDYFYDNVLNFVVQLDADDDKHAVVGVAGGFTDQTVGHFPGEDINMLRVLPFQMQDGKNDAGLMACYNVVPLEAGDECTITEPTIEKRDTICALMLVYHVLRTYTTAEAAAIDIPKMTAIWFPKALTDMHFGLQLLIADGTKAFVLNFGNNKVFCTEMKDLFCMSNYRYKGVTFNDDGTVYTPATRDETHDAVKTNGVQPHGQGLERSNVVASGYSALTDLAAAKTLLQSLYYSNAYDADALAPWYTEFTGGTLRVDSPTTDFAEIMTAAQEAWEARDREDPKVWHTVHSCIYTNDKLYIATQEGTTYTEIALYGT